MRKFSFLFFFSCCLLLFIGTKAVMGSCLIGKDCIEEIKKTEKAESLEEKEETKEKMKLNELVINYSSVLHFLPARELNCLTKYIHLPLPYGNVAKQPPQGPVF